MCADQTKEPTFHDLRAISARREAYCEEQKRELARKIHNELSQKATVLGLELSLLGMDSEATLFKEKIAKLSALAAELSASIRDITNQVHPRIIDEFGLVDALKWYANKLEKEVPCAVHSPATPLVLTPLMNQVLFNISQALVSCVFKPARVSQLEIRLERRSNQIHLRLSGDHKTPWEPPATAEANLDWLAIQEQALRIDGKIKLTTIPGAGTSVVCSIPLKPESETFKSP